MSLSDKIPPEPPAAPRFLGFIVGAFVSSVVMGIILGLTFLAGPQIETRLFPIINPHTDIVTLVRIDQDRLCWRSEFYKLRVAEPVGLSRSLRITTREGLTSTMPVLPIRLDGPNVMDLPVGHQIINWCLPLHTTDFSKLVITFRSEYRTHGLWLVPVARTSISYTPETP